MNKDAHVIAISHEKLSSMTENELREAMKTELDQIERKAANQSQHIIEDYEPYIEAAIERRERFERKRLLEDLVDKMELEDLVDKMEIKDLQSVLNAKGYVLLTRSESEAIIDYMGIKSMLGEVFK